MMNNDAVKEWAFEKFQMFQSETNMDAEFQDNAPIHNKNFEFLSKNKPTRAHSGYSKIKQNLKIEIAYS